RTALIGREHELSELHAAFDAVRTERPVMMLVRGRSGIGKSALAERFASELRARDVVVLRGRCHERESLPYKAFDGVVDALGAHTRRLPRERIATLDPRETGALLRVFPHLRRARELLGDGAQVLPASQQELRRLAFAGLKALLHALCRERAVVLIVDDLQWADLDSARLLLELLGPPDAPGLLYVGCYREDEIERSEFLRVLTRAQSEGDAARELALAALPPAAATALALEVLRGAVDDPEQACARIARESEGVPLLVRELCAHFVKDTARSASGPALRDLLAARVSALDAGELCALSLLSLAARPISERVLAHALREEPGVQRALRALRVHGLVHADAQGSFVVYHDRLREHVTERAGAPREGELTTRALHRRLAEAYEAAQSGEPEWLIEHWQAAGDDANAYRYALTAAELAIGKLAFNRAAGLYAAAIALAPADDPRRVELGAARGEALVNAGRGAEAARAFSSAAARALAHAPDVALELRCRATQQLLRSGHLPEAARLLRELFVEVGLRYPEHALEVGVQLIASRARLAVRLRLGRKRDPVVRASVADDPLLRRRLHVLGAMFREHIVSDPVRAPLFHTWYYEAALSAGDAQAMFNALIWDTYFYVAVHGASAPREQSERLERIHRLANELGTPLAQANAELIHGTADLYASRYPEALAREQRALTIFREQCLGTAWEESVCALTLYTALENVGPMTVMRRDARAFVRRARERDDQLTDALLSITWAARCWPRIAPTMPTTSSPSAWRGCPAGSTCSAWA
ncbi:MAG TPA: ATP-binding protein, partial [Polyangiales bacterium]|nr:ATP-binding protein [Polyangiales bacterium]